MSVQEVPLTASSRWSGTVDAMPASLADLAGPPDGTVELPGDLAWSGRTIFDLNDAEQRYLYYMTVLTSGITSDHYTRWLNADVLCEEWSRLRLPRPLRRIWQQRFPELAALVV
ncbi:hypothetical protein [Sphaerisporangium rufum]|uniref:hypothetical protein n=1 Tax=Sphaerisporangium rufum TaxID=1381558 RepID=UPI0019504315|nr:hypothetical protein [Sphaerisporangium rufum]